mmetsp:Transcript_5655/g.13148  ORF Transcript_5655/g.13148 Transcript_5655/m.13148 type:complete len:84 (+) Transcript_5655:413-664(+)
MFRLLLRWASRAKIATEQLNSFHYRGCHNERTSFGEVKTSEVEEKTRLCEVFKDAADMLRGISHDDESNMLDPKQSRPLVEIS